MKERYLFRISGFVLMLGFLFFNIGTFAQNKYALDFTSQYVRVGDDASNNLDVITDWTFECWFNADAQTDYDDLLFRDGVFNLSLRDKNATGSGDFGIYFRDRNSSINLGTEANENLSLNTWYHVAVTYDGSTARMYIDGIEVANSGEAWNLETSTNSIFIAKRYGDINYFNGQIDEIRMSNIARATSAMQLSTHKEEYSSDANTVFLMHFNDQAATPTYISGVELAGTVSDDILIADYLDGEIATAKLLRPSYRSKATGNWNAAANWEYDNTGAENWVDATLSPSMYDDIITIQNGHTITISETDSIDQTTIDVGGQITVGDASILTINDGTGTDLTIDGTLRKEGNGAILYPVSTELLAFNDGGKFELAGTNRYIPEATWHDNSTCEITGAIEGDMSSTYHTDQEFGNFIWNCSGQTSDVYFSGALTNIDGDFTLVSTNTYELRFTGSIGTNASVYIDGNVDIQGGTLNLTSGTNYWRMYCNGNFTQSGGTIKADGVGTGYLRFSPISGDVSGTFTHSGGTFTPEDIQVNSSFDLTLASNLNIGDAPLTVIGTLTIPATYKLTIPSGGVATLYGEMTVDGTLINSEGTAGLVIKSNISGTGSLIENDGVNATVERYIVQYSDDDHGWHLLGSPVATFDINGFDFDPGDNDDLYRWEETTGLWMNHKAGDPTQIIPGTGYLTAWENTDTKEFTGVLNNSDVAISGLTYTSANEYTGAHLLGNPFPSAIKWHGTGNDWSLNSISTTAKVWNETNASYSDIGANGIIPSANGFMVEATASAASLNIPKAARIHDDQAWYKNTDHYIMLTARDLENNTAQETNIRLNEQATNTYDPLFDSHFFKGFAPSFYSLNDEHALSTNTFSELNEDLEISLGFIKNDASQFTIELDLEKLMPDTDVFLSDLKTGTVQDMVANPVYLFTAFDGDDPNRFKLGFAETNAIASPAPANQFTAFVQNDIIHIKGIEALDGKVSLLDISGRMIATAALQNGNCELNASRPTGVYLVRIITDKGLTTKKIFIQ